MVKFLVYLGPILIANSIIIAGRFGYPAVREGNALDRIFIGVQIGLNIAALLLATALPSLTEFRGQPWLSYTAAALIAAALATFHVRKPVPRLVGPRASGKRSEPRGRLRETRWIYKTLFTLGYVALLFYTLPLATEYAGMQT